MTTLEKEEVTTSTTITERFAGPSLGTETVTETTHIKLYPVDSNSFYLSVTNRIETPHPDGRQLEDVILDEFLVCEEICSSHLKDLLSDLCLLPHIQDYIAGYISREALNWKTYIYPEIGYKIEVNVKGNVEYEKRDGEVGLTELSGAVSRTDLGCSDDSAETKITRKSKHVSTLKTSQEEMKGCILDKEIFTSQMQIEYRPIESKRFSFSVTYENSQEIRSENLDGHKVRVTLKRPVPRERRKVEYTFPDQFVMSKEACNDQILIVLSEMDLPSNDDRESIVRYLSKEAVVWSSDNGEGILHEINVKQNFDNSFEVKCCSGEEDACSSRILKTRMAEIECVICEKELSSEVSHMELPCSHLFHKDCLMTWLQKDPSCPICRNNVVDPVAIVF